MHSKDNIEGRVFVSEDLTQARSKVFYNARLERRAGRFLHVWTRDGRINIRLHDKTVRVITLMAELDDLVDETPIPQERDPQDDIDEANMPVDADTPSTPGEPHRSYSEAVQSPNQAE